MECLQEKFQVVVGPLKHEDGEGWSSFASVRKTYPCMPPEQLPPTGIKSPVTKQDGMKLVTAGATDVTDDVNPWVFRQGFNKKRMAGTDDMYTGEHADQFYGDAGGFVERNNYLDRE